MDKKVNTKTLASQNLIFYWATVGSRPFGYHLFDVATLYMLSFSTICESWPARWKATVDLALVGTGGRVCNGSLYCLIFSFIEGKIIEIMGERLRIDP